MDPIRITTIPNSAVVGNPSIIHVTAQLSRVPGADVTLPISEAMFSRIASAVDAAFALHNRTNGSTVSLIHGNMADRKLFAVSIYPARKIELWTRPSWQELFEFAKANLDLLLKPDHALGTWFDDYELIHCLDMVVLVRDLDDAVELGLRSDQVAIFDLEARREIPIRRSRHGFNASLQAGGAR